MLHRTPSFVVAGLLIVVFIVGSFYMSCSSKSKELRQTLDDFEERVRTLTLKNSDNERKIDSINSRKRELEEEKSDIQKQLEKKDLKIDELNTQINEKTAEIKSLRSDKQVLDEQLTESKTIHEKLSSKQAIIDKLQEDLNEAKKSNNEELTRLKQELENYKMQSNNTEKLFLVPVQRFRPLLSVNETFQNVQESFSNLTNKIKTKFSNIFSNEINSTSNETIPYNKTQQQLSPNEPVQIASENNTADEKQSDSKFPQRVQLSLDNKHVNETQLDAPNAPIPLEHLAIVRGNKTDSIHSKSQLSADGKNYRKRNRRIKKPIEQ